MGLLHTQPLSVPQLAQDLGPQQEDSPCSPGVAMVLAHRTPNTDCAALGTDQRQTQHPLLDRLIPPKANSISAQLGLDVPAPSLLPSAPPQPLPRPPGRRHRRQSGLSR